MQIFVIDELNWNPEQTCVVSKNDASIHCVLLFHGQILHNVNGLYIGPMEIHQ